MRLSIIEYFVKLLGCLYYVWMEICVCMNMMQGEGVLCYFEKCFLLFMDSIKRNDERIVDVDLRKCFSFLYESLEEYQFGFIIVNILWGGGRGNVGIVCLEKYFNNQIRKMFCFRNVIVFRLFIFVIKKNNNSVLFLKFGFIVIFLIFYVV